MAKEFCFDTQSTDDPYAFVFNAIVGHATSDDERQFQTYVRFKLSMDPNLDSGLKELALAAHAYGCSDEWRSAKDCLSDLYSYASLTIQRGTLMSLHEFLTACRATWDAREMLTG
ncbi:hypothetical protein [Burkholderia multivorans]|uniref:hypothetical protein n=1 Tax=Burkholderia multivorans TaxID=87883 RepID=UPI001B9A88E3|nr:hypothetical protein [Burkholderia multivorans]MBR8019540.1 hypothetical protein [Burkholderia multivorans]HEF4729990.1 hypothetical protein [Burkholderia multivorans]HEF4734286.1 hypothetical protein [Burkholderia multivorans]